MDSDIKYKINITDEDKARSVRIWFINEYVRSIINKDYPDIYTDAEKKYEEFIKTLPSSDQEILNLGLRQKES